MGNGSWPSKVADITSSEVLDDQNDTLLGARFTVAKRASRSRRAVSAAREDPKSSLPNALFGVATDSNSEMALPEKLSQSRRGV